MPSNNIVNEVVISDESFQILIKRIKEEAAAAAAKAKAEAVGVKAKEKAAAESAGAFQAFSQEVALCLDPKCTGEQSKHGGESKRTKIIAKNQVNELIMEYIMAYHDVDSLAGEVEAEIAKAYERYCKTGNFILFSGICVGGERLFLKDKGVLKLWQAESDKLFQGLITRIKAGAGAKAAQVEAEGAELPINNFAELCYAVDALCLKKEYRGAISEHSDGIKIIITPDHFKEIVKAYHDVEFSEENKELNQLFYDTYDTYSKHGEFKSVAVMFEKDWEALLQLCAKNQNTNQDNESCCSSTCSGLSSCGDGVRSCNSEVSSFCGSLGGKAATTVKSAASEVGSCLSGACSNATQCCKAILRQPCQEKKQEEINEPLLVESNGGNKPASEASRLKCCCSASCRKNHKNKIRAATVVAVLAGGLSALLYEEVGSTHSHADGNNSTNTKPPTPGPTTAAPGTTTAAPTPTPCQPYCEVLPLPDLGDNSSCFFDEPVCSMNSTDITLRKPKEGAIGAFVGTNGVYSDAKGSEFKFPSSSLVDGDNSLWCIGKNLQRNGGNVVQVKSCSPKSGDREHHNNNNLRGGSSNAKIKTA